MAGLAVTLALMASVAGGFTWTVGTACLSVSSEELRQVDQDHADAAAALDLGALGDAVNDAAVADHDLAGDLGRVQGAGPAQGRARWRGRGCRVGRQHDAGVR